MGYFAKVENGLVTQVIVADSEFVDSINGEPSAEWIETSLETFGGVHSAGGVPLRKNYAGVGFSYDANKDAFIPPKPYASWVLNDSTCLWESPTPRPEGNYFWDESAQQWVESTFI